MSATIIDRGRGPETAGTRITVYDLVDYFDRGWTDLDVASLLRLGTAQVRAGRRYIEAHEAEVRAAYAPILERIRAGNPPEVEARLRPARERIEPHRRARESRTGDADGGPGR